ncbi:MAG: hypothetical protein EOM62_14200 [Bacteroidia bacterium]|nr:hypothetical protein [Bacteroidia bacterium]
MAESTRKTMADLLSAISAVEAENAELAAQKAARAAARTVTRTAEEIISAIKVTESSNAAKAAAKAAAELEDKKAKAVAEVKKEIPALRQRFLSHSALMAVCEAFEAGTNLTPSQKAEFWSEALASDQANNALRSIAGAALAIWGRAADLLGSSKEVRSTTGVSFPIMLKLYKENGAWEQVLFSGFNRKHSTASSKGKASQKPTPKKR